MKIDPHINELNRVLSVPWPERDEDVKKCFEILFRDHPDGVLGPLFIKVQTTGNGNLEITFNPTVVKWIDYFREKYGQELGLKIHSRFTYEYIFEPPLAAQNAGN